MVLFVWITFCCLLVPAVTVSPEPRCVANHTELLLLVDLTQNINLTITRLKNIVSYFITKVKDGIIKNLDVCLVDPFQEKTFFNLTKVNSTQEITPAIDQLVKSNVKLNIYLVNKTLSNAPMYFQKNSFNNMDKNKQHVVLFLAKCYFYSFLLFNGDCNFTINILQRIFNKFKDILMISLLIHPSNMKSQTYNKYYQKDYSTDKQLYLIVDNHDDFTNYNPVAVYACRECPVGWIRYNQTVSNRLSCYFLDIMDASMSWKNASNVCESMKSNLPMFETEDELMFLKNNVRQAKVALTADLNASQTSAVVYIGLMSKGNTFIWKNSRYFFLDYNLAEIVDYRRRCVSLTLPTQENYEKDDFSWMFVRCDKPNPSLLVCELEVNLIHNMDEIKAQLQVASEVSPRRRMSRQLDKDPITNIHIFFDIYFKKRSEDFYFFFCEDEEIPLSYSSVCDGHRTCANGRDELYCYTLSKEEGLGGFYCENPNRVNDYPIVYVPIEARCDGIQDCPDRSDEKGCNGCLGRQCDNGACLPRHWLSRDFEACNLFIGAYSTPFINVSYSCISPCSGLIQFDHEISFCNRNFKVKGYSEGELLYDLLTGKIEWAPKCLYLRGSDERPTGCHDKYQLRDCTTFQCPEGFIKCINSYCVPVYNVRDGVLNCPFGEDEELVIDINDVNDIYQCKNSSTYTGEITIHIHQVHICDGIAQCPNGLDESLCPFTCPTGFKCNEVSVSVINNALVQEIKSLNIFDIKTKFLNISGIDLSKLNETFIFPNLLEIHASNCNLVELDVIFHRSYQSRQIFTANFSYNKLKRLTEYGPLCRFLNLKFLDLSHNEKLTFIDYNSMWSTELQTLDLSFTGISFLRLIMFERSNSLRSLNLCNTKLGQIGNLLKIKRLDFFNLEKTSLGEEDMRKLLRSVSVRSALYVDSYKYCCPKISTGGTPKQACHAPPEAFSSCEDLVSDSLKRLLLWIVAVISLAGNSIVIIYRFFYDRGVFKKGYGIFVTNLSVSDFVMGVYLLIIASTDVRYRDEYVLRESVWRYSALCQAAGFMSTLSSETSTFFIFLITLDRCLVIRFPFGQHRFTKLGLVLSITFSWILGFILASIPLMYPKWMIYSSNGMCFGLPLAIGIQPGWHYSFGVFICFNFIVFLFIACGQMLIFRLIFSSNSFQMTNAARRMQDINVAKQLFLIVLSNFLCWFPICVLGFMSLTGYHVSPDTYAWLAVFIMPLNAAVNPMIYTMPVIYRKWQDFRKGETTRISSRANQPKTLETKL